MKVSFNLPEKYVNLIDRIKDSDDTLLTRTAALIKILREYRKVLNLLEKEATKSG